MSSDQAAEDGQDPLAPFIIMYASETFDGQERVFTREAYDLHCAAAAHSARCGHPGFVPDEYLNSLVTETTVPAAELCAIGTWERVDGGYRVLDWEAVEVCIDWHARKRGEDPRALAWDREHQAKILAQTAEAMVAAPPCAECGNPSTRTELVAPGQLPAEWDPVAQPTATPLEVLLAAERAALLAGRDDEFTMLVTIAYTGMRWGETIGLERDLVLPTLINVEWQLREIRGRFFRIPPKDDSYRSTNWEPLVPVDTPVFLAELLTAQADKNPHRLCACAREHGGSGRYMFYSPDGGHYRRSNFARRVFRPACDGRYEAVDGRPGSLVVVDATTWPGTPAASWPPAMPGKPFTPPSGRGVPRLVSTGGTGHCSSCGRTVTLRLDGKAIIHKITDGPCPGSGQQPSEDAPLACWLPVKDGLTPHGLRHSHKTWMVEDGIPEILAEQRLGHDVPGMRGLYAHASQRMREELLTALQARWEQSLRERARIHPHSPVPLLDGLLAPFRADPASAGGAS